MKKFIAAIICAAATAGAALGQSSNYFHASGQDIIAPDGSPFLIRANAPSAWLSPEAYALKLNAVHKRHIGSFSDIQIRIGQLLTNQADADLFWSAYQSNYFTEADVADMKAEGFNAIRLPINYRMLQPWCCTGQWDNAGFQVISNVIDWCRSNDLYVIIDLHAAPGGQSADPPADPEQTYWTYDAGISNWVEKGVACLWESNGTYFANTGRTPEWNQQRTIDIWREIATRFAGETQVLGYDLINEPYLPWGINGPVLRSLLTNITAAIRSVDTNHLIIVEDNFFAGTLENVSPAWDGNMAYMFHKYWRPTQLSEIQQYIDVATSNNVPLIMGESGENSSPWFYEFKNLLESNNIGWCWWGWKKVDAITAALSVPITTNYQYVIDNFRDLPVNAARVKQGLMEMADLAATANCEFDPGWYDALLGTQFGSEAQAFVTATLPGRLYAVNYDVGNQGIAYSDTRYKNEENWNGDAWNWGWKYRNDGVDIFSNTDSQGIGVHVGSTDSGEWLKYTANVQTGGNYRLSLRVATSGGRIALYTGTTNLTGTLVVSNTGGYGTWKTQTNANPIALAEGSQSFQLNIVSGGVDVAWLDFAFVPPPTAAAPTFSPNGGTFTGSVNVTLASATEGATIYYTADGSTPTTASSSTTNGGIVTLTQPFTESLRAFAAKAGYVDSAVSVSVLFDVVATPVAADPTFSPDGGTYTGSVAVTLSSATAGATIHYTTDGSTPTTSSPSKTNNGVITLSQPYSNSVRAMAVKSGYVDSDVAVSVHYDVVAAPVVSAPTFSPNGGIYTNAIAVTLSSATAGSTIHYTTNGTAPTTNSPSIANNGTVTLAKPYTNAIRAFAKLAGSQNSAITTSATFSVVAMPPVGITNGALTGTGTSPNGWQNWNDGSHDPRTSTSRSSPNSWDFWWDGGIYQDVTTGFTNGQQVTFGGYLRHPSTDALRNGTKYGIIQLEFRDASDQVISTASTAQINSSSTKNSWLSRSATATVPSGTAKLRIVVRCNDWTSGSGRFFADDLFVQ